MTIPDSSVKAAYEKWVAVADHEANMAKVTIPEAHKAVEAVKTAHAAVTSTAVAATHAGLMALKAAVCIDTAHGHKATIDAAGAAWSALIPAEEAAITAFKADPSVANEELYDTAAAAYAKKPKDSEGVEGKSLTEVY